MIVGRRRLQPPGEGLAQLALNQIELGLHLAQGNQRQDRLRVLIRAERRVGPQLAGGPKQTTGEVLKVN